MHSAPAGSCTCVVRVDDGIAAIAPLMRESVVIRRPVRSSGCFRTITRRAPTVIVASHPEESYRAIWDALREAATRGTSFSSASCRTIAHAARRSLQHATATDPDRRLEERRLAVPDADRHVGRLPNGLSAKFRSNLRNRLSRLTKIGEPRSKSSPSATRSARLDDVWRLEASGWKQTAGTAITSDPRCSASIRP